MSECLFCRIVQRSMPARIVAEDEHALAFEDIRPQAPTHVLIIPKVHIASMADITEESVPVASNCLLLAAKLAKQLGVSADGYRVVTNSGAQAGQTVGHLHFHLLAGRPMGWPPG